MSLFTTSARKAIIGANQLKMRAAYKARDACKMGET
jgi:hypothetical protein